MKEQCDHKIIKFVPFRSSPEPQFWMTLGKYKIETIKLKEDAISITGSYGITPVVTPKEKHEDTSSSANNKVIAPGRIRLDEYSVRSIIESNIKVDDDNSFVLYDNENVKIRGQILILNTMESFKTKAKFEKNAILNKYCLPIILDACGLPNSKSSRMGKNETKSEEEEIFEIIDKLTSFFCLAYMDLKNHKIYYWFAFPALVPAPGKSIRFGTTTGPMTVSLKEAWGESKVRKLHKAVHDFRVDTMKKGGVGCPAFFNVQVNDQDGSIKCVALAKRGDTCRISKNVEVTNIYVFIDSTSTSLNFTTDERGEPLGWMLRNLIAYLSIGLDLGGKDVTILSFRPGILRRIQDNINDNCKSKVSEPICMDSSLLLKAFIPNKEDYKSTRNGSNEETYICNGWELNHRSKPIPRFVDLAPLLSPTHLAQQATDLNLNLMKWRMIPNLDLESLKTTKVLLLGAGTLGCNVARILLGWGIRNFTFVDNGRVSYSNPVRQNLFELKDCENGGEYKAVAAANALRRIAGPTVISKGIVLTVPMPGHSFETKNEELLKRDIEIMQSLFTKSDVVFLLTDTRESRWLPTVMARAHDKMIINAALGLDSWLVIRHGGNKKGRLGCYFCNDVSCA